MSRRKYLLDENQPEGRLLIVDDVEDNRELLVRRLGRSGYETAVAPDGETAVRRVLAGRFDTVLLDIRMPGMSGLEVLDKIREHYDLASLPVIMVTALDEAGDVVNALELGANDYVTKPIDYPVLLARVRTCMRLKRLNEIKEEFLGVASHDLKNPLTRILTAAAVLRTMVERDPIPAEKIVRMADAIERGGQQMHTLIRDFLDQQSMLDVGFSVDKSESAINELIEEVAEFNRPDADAKVMTIGTELAGDLETAHFDRERIRQVLQNLVSNAVKFGRTGNRITVSSRNVEGAVRVEVRDQGPGLTEEDLKRVFQRYARLSAVPTGKEVSTGLGLSICRRMVSLHGGTIGVENNDPPPGATFWFELPVET